MLSVLTQSVVIDTDMQNDADAPPPPTSKIQDSNSDTRASRDVLQKRAADINKANSDMNLGSVAGNRSRSVSVTSTHTDNNTNSGTDTVVFPDICAVDVNEDTSEDQRRMSTISGHCSENVGSTPQISDEEIPKYGVIAVSDQAAQKLNEVCHYHSIDH